VKRALALRPSPALVIACIALFISLGGVSYGLATGFIDSREIRNETIRTQDVRNNDLRAIDIRNSTIRSRDVALDTLTGADIKESKLGQVPSAADATSLGGAPASSYLRREASVFLPLLPATDWDTVTPDTPPGYLVDPFGFVHLHGVLRRVTGTSELALNLPAQARPDRIKRVLVYGENAGGGVSAAGLVIKPNGEVTVKAASDAAENLISLEGVTFRVDD